MNLSGSVSAIQPHPGLVRRAVGMLAGTAAIVMMLVSGCNFRWLPGQLWTLPEEGLKWLAVGAVTLALAVWLLRPVTNLFSMIQVAEENIAVQWRYVIGGVSAIAIMAESNSRAIFKEFALSQHLQALLFAGGALSLAYGLGGFRDMTWRGVFGRVMLPLWLIVIFGFLLRCWNLAEDVHIMIDELHFFEGVLHLWKDPNLPLIEHIDGIAAFPHFFTYVERWTIALINSDFAGIRFTSVLFGSLTIPATYYLGRAISDHKTGLLAAALLAVFPPHIHFSRLALNNIADPLPGTLAVGLLVSALRYNRTRDFVLAGLFLGLTAYFYEGGRLFFLALGILWPVLMLVMYGLRTYRRGLLRFGVMAAVVAGPYYYYALTAGVGLTPRLNEQGRLGYLMRDLLTEPGAQVLLRHYDNALRPAIFHTIYAPDSSMFYYGGSTGILLWFMVPFYFLGLLYLLYRAPAAGILLWLWLIIALLGISLVVSTDWTVRFCVLFPLMMLAVALGLRYPFEMIVPRLARGAAGNGLLIAAVVLLGAAELRYYYVEHLPVYNVQVRKMHDFYDAFDRAAQYPSVNRLVYVTDDAVFRPVLDIMRAFRPVGMLYTVWHRPRGFQFRELLEALGYNNSVAFAIVPGDSETLSKIQAVFPVTRIPWSIYASVPRDSQYAIYVYIPPSWLPYLSTKSQN